MTGVQKTEGGSLRVDLAWKSFLVDSEVRVGNVTINRIGDVYLASAVERLLQITPTQGRVFRTAINGVVATNATYLQLLYPIVSFDLSALSAPVETWKETYSFSNQQTSWATGLEVGFIVLGRGAVFEPEGTVTLDYQVSSRSSARITASGVAGVAGDTIFLEARGAIESFVMAAIIVGVVLLGITAFLVERSVSRTRYRKRK